MTPQKDGDSLVMADDNTLFDATSYTGPSMRAVLDDLGAWAHQWSRDLARYELAALSRLYDDKPERYRIASYVLLTMGATGETDITAEQLARELGRTAGAVRKTLSRLYADGVLEASQQRSGRMVVRRVIGRGERLRFLRLMAQGLCDSQKSQTRASGSHEPVTPRSHSPKRERTKESAAGRRSESAGVAQTLPEALPADDATSAAALAEARERLRRSTPVLTMDGPQSA